MKFLPIKTLLYKGHGYITLKSMEGHLAELKGQTSSSLRELNKTGVKPVLFIDYTQSSERTNFS